jgi:hypothetical protein
MPGYFALERLRIGSLTKTNSDTLFVVGWQKEILDQRLPRPFIARFGQQPLSGLEGSQLIIACPQFAELIEQ